MTVLNWSENFGEFRDSEHFLFQAYGKAER
jgi:hypothetical protein